MAAACGNDVETVEEILRLPSSNVEAKDKWGKTALMYCATGGVVNALVAANANLEAKSSAGLTAVMIAAEAGHE